MEKRKGILFAAAATVAVVLLVAANIAFGSVSIPLGEIAAVIEGNAANDTYRYIILESRLPQAITAMMCGASLAVCGLMLQTAFNNPLAGPSIFGINSGASLGVAVVILLMHGSISANMLSINGFAAIITGAFIGSAAVIVLLLAFARVVRNNVVLLIIGIMFGYLASSAISLLNFFATDQSIAAYVMWGMANFGSVSSQHLPLFAGLLAAAVCMSLLMIKPLNALLLGDRYAENLGFKTQRVKFCLLLITGIQTAVTTAYCGPVAFIGLAVPHITRMLLNTDNHAVLMPCTILSGAVTALLCNLVCTLPPDGTVIPLNAITPVIGAPVIIYVTMRQRG